MTTTVQWALWAVVMSVVLGLTARAWKKQASTYTGEELRHPKVILFVAVGTGAPFLAGTIAALLFAGKDRWVALVFLAFAGLGAYLLWEYVVVRYTLSAEGFGYRTLRAGRGFGKWPEVSAVKWSQTSKWFRLELSGGRVVRVSVLMLGLDRLAAALIKNASGAVIDPDSRQVLEQCARGNPPSPWG